MRCKLGGIFSVLVALTFSPTPVLATTTYNWSCQEKDAAETGYITKQGAQSAAKAHENAHPGHKTVVDTVTDEQLKKQSERYSKKLLSETPSDCNMLLKDGVFDTREIFGTSFEQQHVIDLLCSKNYQSYGEAYSDGLSIGIPIGDFMASLGFSSDKKSFETNYQTLCTHKENYKVATQSSYTMVRTASTKLAEEFTKCTADKRFVAYVSPVDTKQFQIVTDYKPTEGQQFAKVKSFSYNTKDITCGNFDKRGIGAAGYVVNCSRQDDKKASAIALNTDAGSQNFKVPAYVPDPPPPIPTSGIGDVVMSLLDGDKFNAQRPGQQWLPCDKIGTGQTAPGTAWAQLTNNGVLPVCADRYPRALGNGRTIGQNLDDTIKKHVHPIAGQEQQADGGTGFKGHGFDSNGGPYTSHQTGENGDGGDETRPKTTIYRFYIRVN